jgi:hypothetical protein
MRKEMLNASGCPDPTAYKAIKNISYMPIIYICSPYRGDVERNTELARGYSKFAVCKGAIPITPHLVFPQFLDDDNEADRKHAIRMNLILLDRCEEIWVFGDRISEGMATEIERAKKRNMIIKHFTKDLKEVR